MKRFITNGDSDIHLVLARSEEGTHDGRGLSMFIYDNREHKATRINESCVRERGETIGSSSDGAEHVAEVVVPAVSPCSFTTSATAA